MKIENITILRGPNLWSIRRMKLIQMRLDLGELENFPTNKITGFADRIQRLMPTLFEHRCSEGEAGGFFSRVKEGTWMGHVIEHIALEIQTLAGMKAGFGRTRETTTPGVYNVVFTYEEEHVGVYAANAAVRIATSLIENKPYAIERDILAMREINRNYRLGPSTLSIVEEAAARGIPWMRLNENSLIQLGYGVNQTRIEATITGNTNYIAVGIAGDKARTKALLKGAYIPVADGGICANEAELLQIIDKIGFPLVIKPIDGNHGKGISINIQHLTDAKLGLIHAQQYSRTSLVEKYVEGFDFRVLLVDYKVVAVAKRIPAHVVGNGLDSIQELIDLTNKNPRRGQGHENTLTQIDIDRDTHQLIEKKGYTLQTVLTEKEVLYLKSTANISTGGTAIDVTEIVHPDNLFLAERIARTIGLDICGIDIMAAHLEAPLKETGGIVLEVNAAPGFRMHLDPSDGVARNVAAPVVDMLYPAGKSPTVPIISITGTNGKTTTTRLLAHIAQCSGVKVGFTTSDGIYIQQQLIEKGDTTGPISARKVFNDPTVELAILETARGGILRSGLGFRSCDIGIITNITADHLGLNDIETLDDLARLKAVVVDSVKPAGWAILNAEDAHCMKIARNLDCQVAYFALDEHSAIVSDLAAKGKMVAVYENGYITLKKGAWKTRIEKVTSVPLTMDGKAKFMIQNVLAATMAAYLHGFTAEQIRPALHTFIPGPVLTPGRLNIFEFKTFKVMIDFAHNAASYLAIEDFLASIDANRKIGIIAGVGDRRDQDIMECGIISARMFDHIIIRQEKHLRGRTEQEMVNLLVTGMQSINPEISYEVIPKEIKAIEHAMSIAQKDDFIIALSDVVSNAIAIVQQHLDLENKL